MQFLTQKVLKNESKLNQNWKWSSAHERAKSADRHMASANWYFPSADWHNSKAQPGNPLIQLEHIYFEFLGIRTQSNSYLISFSLFFKHPTSINRGKKLEIRALLLAFFSNFFAPFTLQTFWKFWL